MFCTQNNPSEQGEQLGVGDLEHDRHQRHAFALDGGVENESQPGLGHELGRVTWGAHEKNPVGKVPIPRISKPNTALDVGQPHRRILGQIQGAVPKLGNTCPVEHESVGDDCHHGHAKHGAVSTHTRTLATKNPHR